ncbi:MAG: gliding motility-associated C-terminal domain-containing protein [Lewinellaceae bacterium]|nr:gliding motility-associated C-terminal domain-containing protein [Lewinellaceae bacterium]
MSLQSTAQTLTTSFTPATASGAVNSTVDLELKVTGFTNVISVQFPVTYQSTILQFVSADMFALPGFTTANYNSLTGKVNVSWFVDLGTNPNGITLAAGSTLMRMRFKILAGGTSAVNLAAVAPGIEFVNSNGNPLTVNYQSGGSSITGQGAPAPITGFHIIANGANVGPGQKYCLPVTVNDFDNILSMQYAMHWNTSVIKFDSTRAFKLPFLTAANFAGNTANGTLLLSWYDQNAVGVSRPDGDTIYQVCFTAVGPVGTSTIVTIDGVGFPGNPGAEIANSMGQNIWTNSVPINDTVIIVNAVLPPNPNAPTFTGDTISVGQGTSGCVPITVSNFDTLLSAQFAITYDQTKLTFQSLQFGSNPLALSAGGNFNTAVPGQIRFTWNDATALGKSLADGTEIFSVCFTAAAGQAGMNVPIVLGSLPTYPVEVVKENGGPVPPNLNQGMVMIVAQVNPTCAVVPTNISCFGGNNGAVNLTTTNASGATFSWTGPGTFTATTEDISALTLAGTYSVTVTTATGSCTSTATITAPAAALSAPAPAVTHVKCNGGIDGLINLSVSGGTSPYTFHWSNNATTEDLSPVPAGAYTVTVTDANSCTAVQNTAVNQPATLPSVSLVASADVKCKGQLNGSATIAGAGGTPGYTFVWKNASGQQVGTGLTVNNLAAGNYFVTVTDVNNCQGVIASPISILEPSAALSVSTSVVNNACPSGTSGVITANAANGWGGATYSWSGPGGSNNVLSGLAAGSYTVTVTDSGGCSVVSTPTNITSPPAIAYSDLQVTHVKCASAGDGAISFTPTGGNGGPYMVTWTPAGSGTSISNLQGGMYIPTIRDANGCSTTMPGIPVNEPMALNAANVIANQSGVSPNGSVNLTVSGGTMPYTFLWSNGAMTEDISGLAANTYTVTITDINNCSFVQSYIVAQDNPLIGSNIVSHTNSCSNNGTVTIAISQIANPPYTLDWGTGLMTNVTTDTVTVSNLAPGVYNFMIFDVDGNSIGLNAVNITTLAPASVSNQIQNTDCNTVLGAILLTPVPATSPMTYAWNTGSNASALISIGPGTYTVTVTNFSSGCTAVYPYTLNCPAANPAAQVVNANCANATNGSIDFSFSGADGPVYSYLWSNGAATQDLNNVSTGTYTVTVTDESGTTFTYNYNVGVNSTMSISNVNILSSYGIWDVSGQGQCDGEASVVVVGASGALNYNWSNGITTPTNETLCSGVFMVTVTDQLGCTSTWADSLSAPPAVTSQATGISNFNGYNVSCNGICDGIARVTVGGGVLPYTVQWPTGQVEELDFAGATSTASNLCGGMYAVTITDAYGSTKVQNVSVSQPDLLTLNFANVAPTSFSRCDGEAIAITSGAVGSIEIIWTASITGQTGTGTTVDALCSGERVQFVARDENGCLVIATDTIPYPVDGCYRVRPVLTPGQQDGKNDYVHITCIESVPNSIDIYNRWGQLVYTSTNYDNAANRWDGTRNGQPLPEGVYYYILLYTDITGDHEQKGYINLLR